MNALACGTASSYFGESYHMSDQAHAPGAADAALSPNQDVGPLAWVVDEVRRSVEAANKALKRFVRDAEVARGTDLASVDDSQLRLARQQLHQAVGALEMVGQPQTALVLRGMESAVQKFVQSPRQCTGAAAGQLERAGFALIEYLEAVVAGRSLSPVALFPQYREVMQLVGADRIHPADLWPERWRWLDIPLVGSPTALHYDASVRARFDQGALRIMRTGSLRAAQDLMELSLGLAAGEPVRQRSLFWRLGAGFFDAIHLARPDVYAKRIASRVLLQYTALARGDEAVSERLAHDMLFYCAQAQPGAEPADAPLRAVRNAYGLARHRPIAYDQPRFGQFDPEVLSQARKRIEALKEGWSVLAGGELVRLRATGDQFGLVAESLTKLHPASSRLAATLQQIGAQAVRSGRAPSAELGMEVATAVLFLEAAFADFEPDDARLTERTNELAGRLDTVARGGASRPLEPWMEDLYRRVSDRQTMGTVVGELRVTLGEVEQLLDQYFRDPSRDEPLRSVPGLLSQMRGVLSVLGLEQAAHAVVRMRESVEDMLRAHMLAADMSTEGDSESASEGETGAPAAHQGAATHEAYERLGNSLGTLGILVDMLNYQPALVKQLFVYDEDSGELRAVMGRSVDNAHTDIETAPTATAAADEELVHDRQSLNATAQAVLQAADRSDAALHGQLEVLATQAALADQHELAASASAAAQAAAQQDHEALAGALARVNQAAAGVAPPPVVERQPEVAQDDDGDDDLRSIFLDEAREVIGTGREALTALAREPEDVEMQTTLRRAFHTLKGSSRMVGLDAFGEAAWSMEQVMNAWLSEQKPITPDARSLSGQALDAFGQWVEDIAARRDAHWQAEPFRVSADALRLEQRLLPLTLPSAAALAATAVTAPHDTVPEVAASTAPAVDAKTEPMSLTVQHGDTSEVQDSGFALTEPLELHDEPEPEPAQPQPLMDDWQFDIPGDGPDATAVDASASGADKGAEPLGAPGAEATGSECLVREHAQPTALDPVLALDQGDGLEALAEPLQVGDDALATADPTDAGTVLSAQELETDGAFDEVFGLLDDPVSELGLQDTPDDLAELDERDFAISELSEEEAAQFDAVFEAQERAAQLAAAAAAARESVIASAPEAPVESHADSAGSTSKEPLPLVDAHSDAPDVIAKEGLGDPLRGAVPTAQAPALAPSVAALSLPELPNLDLPDLSLNTGEPPDSLSVRAADGASDEVELLPLGLGELEFALQTDSDEAAAAEAQDVDGVRTIGDLQISTPLYNVYLGEAEDWSRQLQESLAHWAEDVDRPLPDHAIALAHSLAGSSATVGFMGLSRLARELEHALQRLHPQARGTAEQAQTLEQAAEEVRALLHQFAAGFLREPSGAVQGAIAALEPTDTERKDEPSMFAATGFSTVSDPMPLEPLEPVASIESAEAGMPAATPAPAQAQPAPMPLVETLDVLTPSSEATPDVRTVTVTEGSGGDEFDVDDALDADLFPIFEEEALELLPTLRSAMTAWADDPGNPSPRGQVLRALHTLKGSARLAGALRLGELTHRLESEIEVLGSEGVQGDQVEPLLGRLDRIESLFTQARTQSLAPPPAAEWSEPVVQAIAEQPAPVSQAGADAVIVARMPGVEIAGPAPLVHALSPASSAGQSVRVRAPLLDRLVNQAGEVMITRTRLEARLGQLRSSLKDMAGNLERLRTQLRDMELQTETQMQSRLALTKEAKADFDPLEFDRFTRAQELTRMMAESVDDVATVQRNVQRAIELTEDDLVQQASLTRGLQQDLLRTRMLEFESLSERLYRVVRQSAKELGKQVKLDIAGGSIEMDRGVLERMTPAFEHLLRNCVVHGIEKPEVRTAAGKDAVGTVTIVVSQVGNDVGVEVRDDGAGLNTARIRERAIERGLITPEQELTPAEIGNLVFMPGFSTASEVSELAGRGVGMDVVRTEVQSLGGRIETRYREGLGSSFKLVLPLTTAVTQVVMVRVGEMSFGVPSAVVEIVRRVRLPDLYRAYASGGFDYSGDTLPFYWGGALVDESGRSAEPVIRNAPVVVFRSAAQRIAVHVDEVLGNQEVVVKNLGPQLSRLPGLTAMTVLADGNVLLVYNPVALAAVYGEQARALTAQALARAAAPEVATPSEAAAAAADQAGAPVEPAALQPAAPPLILVVDDSITVRRVTQRLLQREGFRVALAADGLQALERLGEERPAVVLSDIEMPRMDGFDLLRNIRADATLGELPVIMITSRIADKHREHAQELGANHYLGKPYSEEELLRLLREFTGQTQPA